MVESNETGKGYPIARRRNTWELWHFPASGQPSFFPCVGLVMGAFISAFLAGCAALPTVRVQLGAGDRSVRPTYPGLIAADEPQAVLVARDVLMAGGHAADAAAALGFALTVTLPSSAGLGGGGACLVHDTKSGSTEALDFVTPMMPAALAPTMPILPRGLYALHAKYGALPWSQVVMPSENLARLGQRLSETFAKDLMTDGGVLVNDSAALRIFMTPRRQMLRAGEKLQQPDLAVVLGRVRTRGPADFYGADFSLQLEAVIGNAGGRVSASDLRAYVPQWRAGTIAEEGATRFFALPRDISGSDTTPRDVPMRPAGTTHFVVADKTGSVVTCTLTMGRSFGSGVVAPGMGFLLATPVPPENNGFTQAIAVHIPHNTVVSAAAGPGADREVKRTDNTRRTALVNMLTCDINREGVVACEAQSDSRGTGYALVLTP